MRRGWLFTIFSWGCWGRFDCTPEPSCQIFLPVPYNETIKWIRTAAADASQFHRCERGSCHLSHLLPETTYNVHLCDKLPYSSPSFSPPSSFCQEFIDILHVYSPTGRRFVRRLNTDSNLAVGCTSKSDCDGKFEECIGGYCAGFVGDKADTKILRCVDGYRCDILAGDIPGYGITNDFQVIGVSPAERCGESQPLPAKCKIQVRLINRFSVSIFANSNRWRCENIHGGDYCAFSPGVGIRRNKTIVLEGLRLCGCPGLDSDKNGVSCDEERDFYVPIAKLGVQECLTNSHCLHKAFAYCVNDHCAGFLGFAASAGVKVYQCLLNKNCSVQSLAAKALSEGLKVLPVASSFNCGGTQALDPNYFRDAALPCVMDVNADGKCDINLGVARALGTNRLCGCNGRDNGGNGRPCDELADFDEELGILEVAECMIDIDCPKGVCVDRQCIVDSKGPFLVTTYPENNATAVPPIQTIKFIFNEDIQPIPDRRVIISSNTHGTRYIIPLSSNTQRTDYKIEVKGRELTITPDTKIKSLAQTEWTVTYDPGLVADIAGNLLADTKNLVFKISADGGCPFLGVTGFQVEGLNLNGIYRAVEPVNGKPRWSALTPAGKADLANSIFWTPKAKWVIGLNEDTTKFMAYSEIDAESFPNRPSTGIWKRWKDKQWTDQMDVVIDCPVNRITTPPAILDTDPLAGSRGVDPDNFTLIFKFDRPVNFGHWAGIIIRETTGKQMIQIDPEDSKVRGTVLLRDLVGNRIIFKPPTKLIPGANYTLTLDTGAFTDLQYNPSSPISEGKFIFTTFGASCITSHIPGGSHMKTISQSELTVEHGLTVQAICEDNYSPYIEPWERNKYSDSIAYGTTYPNLTATVFTFECNDGLWEGLPDPRCKAMCAQYQPLGSQYKVTVVSAATDDKLTPFGTHFDLQTTLEKPFMKHGSEIRLRCVETSESLAGSPLGEISTCQDGRWSKVSLKCGETCGSPPSLGPAYKILDNNNNDVRINSYRIIGCNSGTGDTNAQQRITCKSDGWEIPALACHYNCQPLDLATLSIDSGLILTRGNPDSQTSHGSAFVFSCDEGTNPQIASDTTDLTVSDYEQTFWDSIANHLQEPLETPLTESQTILACFEGAWRPKDPLVCQSEKTTLDDNDSSESCPIFIAPGPGYDSKMILGDGISPGTTYEIWCSGDAVTSIRNERSLLVDTAVCLSGEWVRMTRAIMCFGSCPHPVVYFGENYIVYDSDSRKLQLPPGNGQGLTFKHHSDGYKIECDEGRQALGGPILSDPKHLDGTEMMEAIPSLIDNPSQTVVCDDGRWLPATNERLTAMATTNNWIDVNGFSLRCVSACPSFPAPSSVRYQREQTSDRLVGWGSKRTLNCKPPFTGAIIHRDASRSYEISSQKRVSADYSCRNGAWFDDLTSIQIWNANMTLIDFRSNLIKSLFCGGRCSRSNLDLMLVRGNLKTTTRIIASELDHGVIIHIQCASGLIRLSGPMNDAAVCSDGQWSVPLLACGKNPKRRGLQSISGQSCAYNREWDTSIITNEATNGKIVTSKNFPVTHGTIVHQYSIENFSTPNIGGLFSLYNEWICGDGVWTETLAALDNAEGPELNCSDGIMGRGEWGIDCGGLCQESCSDCEDGIQNGKEEYVDCGGPECRSCRACSEVEFKFFIHNPNYVVTNMGNAHGSKRELECSPLAIGQSEKLILECRDGSWLPEGTNIGPSGISYFCETEDSYVIKDTIFRKFKTFPTGMTLSICQASNPASEQMAHYCCPLVKAIVEELSGECGALLFSGSDSKVEAYCQGFCHARIKQLTSFFSRKDREIMSDLQTSKLPEDILAQMNICHSTTDILSNVADLYCVTNPSERDARNDLTTGPLKTSKSEYCFTQAYQALKHIQEFNVYNSKEDLDIICVTSSCFRSNLLYFSQLWDLVSSFTLTRSETGRSSSDVTFRKSPILPPGEMNLKFHPSIIHLVCLVDTRGTPCATQLPRLLNVFNYPGMVISPDDQKELGETIDSYTTTACSSNTCFLEIVRYLGQHLSTQGTAGKNPYQRFLGTILKLYGRYYCQRDTVGRSCALKFFGNVFSTSLYVPKSQTSPLPANHNADILKILTSCDPNLCPPEYIGDGLCDEACFNSDCAYDGRDCFIANMFPTAVKKLVETLPPGDMCHPLNPELEKCESPGCYNSVREAILSDGCCFAVGVDILKELMDIEFYSHPLLARGSANRLKLIFNAVFSDASRQEFEDAGGFSLKLYEKYLPNRSSQYAQVICNLFVDRTCSRGLARRVLTLEFVFESVPYDGLYWLLPEELRNVDGGAEFPRASDIDLALLEENIRINAPYHRLVMLLRKQITDLFALSLSDFRDLRVWPDSRGSGSRFYATLDPGLFTNEVMRSLNEARRSGELSLLLTSIYREWRSTMTPDMLLLFLFYESDGSNRLLQQIDIYPDYYDYSGSGNSMSGFIPKQAVSSISIGSVDVNAVEPGSRPSFNGGDPLPSFVGALDLGDYKSPPRGCSLRISAILDNGVLSTFSLTSDFITNPASVRGVHGEAVEISCKSGFAPRVHFADMVSQGLICSNGRWITESRKEIMTCHRICPEFVLPDDGSGIYQASGSGRLYGSFRMVTCSAGYSGSKSAGQKILCIDGVWQPVILVCHKAPLFGETCGGIDLEPLASDYNLAFSEVFSGRSMAGKYTWWRAGCQRGYKRAAGSDPLQVVCMDDEILYSFGTYPAGISNLFSKVPVADTSKLETALRQYISDGIAADSVAIVDMSRLMWNTEAGIPLLSSRNPTLSLACQKAYISDATLLKEQGIDDWTYIGIVAAASVGVTLTFALWGYYWQVRGKARRAARKRRKLEKRQGNLPTTTLNNPTTSRDNPTTDSGPDLVGSGIPSTQPPGIASNAPNSQSFYSDLEYFTHQNRNPVSGGDRRRRSSNSEF